jgi:hypothetical protein
MKQASAFLSLTAILILIAAQATFVANYVGREHTIYFWDHAMYFDMARSFYEHTARDASAGWAAFRHSLADNYNLIFALPSLISFELFGVSRLVFILTNFFVFFLGYEIAVAFFLARTLGFKGNTAFIISLVIAFLIPPLWLPLLEGYPDIGAAACLVFAAGLGLAAPTSVRIFHRALGLGCVLGAAVLLRRHFVYPAMALLLSLLSLALWDILRTPKNRTRQLTRTIMYFGLCSASFAGFLILSAPDFVSHALTTDYGTLYLSYRRPADMFLYFVVGGFGLGLLLAAASGLVLLAGLGRAARKVSLFITLFVLMWFVLWALGPDQMGHHYMLHVLPLAIATGLVGWFIYFENKRCRIKDSVGAACLLVLMANSMWALGFSPTGVWPNDNGTPGIFSAPRPPVIRSDYGEWLRLADYLRRTTTPNDHIMVVGSSFIFNQDLLHNIYRDTPDGAGMILRLPKTPEIDHEEPAPLDVFAAADVYLVPKPAQYHLDPSGQRVITAAANQFPPPPLRKSMFTADDALFHLSNGVVVKVWRRTPWTPAVLHDTLAQIRRDAAADKIFAQDWATIVMPLRTQIRTDGQNVSIVAGLFDADHRDLKLFFDHPLAPGRGRLAFVFTGTCGPPKLHLTVVSARGKIEESKDRSLLVVPGEVFQPFTVAEQMGEDRFLELDVTVATAAFCHAELGDLRIEKS